LEGPGRRLLGSQLQGGPAWVPSGLDWSNGHESRTLAALLIEASWRPVAPLRHRCSPMSPTLESPRTRRPISPLQPVGDAHRWPARRRSRWPTALSATASSRRPPAWWWAQAISLSSGRRTASCGPATPAAPRGRTPARSSIGNLKPAWTSETAPRIQVISGSGSGIRQSASR